MLAKSLGEPDRLAGSLAGSGKRGVGKSFFFFLKNAQKVAARSGEEEEGEGEQTEQLVVWLGLVFTFQKSSLPENPGQQGEEEEERIVFVFFVVVFVRASPSSSLLSLSLLCLLHSRPNGSDKGTFAARGKKFRRREKLKRRGEKKTWRCSCYSFLLLLLPRDDDDD